MKHSSQKFQLAKRITVSFDFSQIFLILFVDFALFNNLIFTLTLTLFHYPIHQFFVLFSQLYLFFILFLTINRRQLLLLASERTLTAVNLQHLFDETFVLDSSTVKQNLDIAITFLEFLQLRTITYTLSSFQKERMSVGDLLEATFVLAVSDAINAIVNRVQDNRAASHSGFLHFSSYNLEDYIAPDLQSNKNQVMGNSRSDVDYAINLDKNFYFSSEEVRGHLFVNSKKRYPCARITIEVEGIESCQFTTFNRQSAKGHKRLIKTSFVLAEFGHNQYLQGQLDFPFSFRFLQYLPGSYEQNKQYKAKVSYTLKAIIFSKIIKDRKQESLQKTIEVIIREPQREGERMLSGQTFASCKNCFCLDRGVSRIYCYFEKNYYFPGDQCIMICEADNTKCGMPISRIKCQFIKEVTLTAANGTSRVFTELLNTVFFPGVGANRSYFGQNAQRQYLKLIHRDSQRAVTPSTNGHFVRCRYYILVQPMFGGWFRRVSDSQFRVYLTILQPAMEYDLIEKPQDWRPNVNETSSFFLNPDDQ